MSENEKPAAIRVAIELLRTTSGATLATVEDGQPFASLVTPAAAPDRSLLMLLSGLSPHTRHLKRDGRCGLMLMGRPLDANPQTAPRLSMTGAARPEPDPTLKARWVALHPYAAFYADLPDFQLWRFEMAAAQFVGGFASARRFAAAELAPDPGGVTAIAASEAAIIGHCNDDHPDALDAIARARGAAGAGWRMVGCDVDGCDLAREDVVQRIGWSGPVSASPQVRAELVRLAAAARNPVASAPGPAV